MNKESKMMGRGGMVLLAGFLLFLCFSSANAAVTYEFNGVVENGNLGSIYDSSYTGGLQAGDDVIFRLTLDETDNWNLLSIFFEVNNYARSGGSAIQLTRSAFTTGQHYEPEFASDGLPEVMYYNYDYAYHHSSYPDDRDLHTLFRFDYDFSNEGVNGGEDNYLYITSAQYSTDGLLDGELQPGGFEINAINMSPVPLPGAVWLLGNGIVGLMAIRRRK